MAMKMTAHISAREGVVVDRNRRVAAATVLAVVAATLTAGGTAAQAAPPTPADRSRSGCLPSPSGNGIRHVIHLQFDNVHFIRHNTNEPPDLEHMPPLLHFHT